MKHQLEISHLPTTYGVYLFKRGRDILYIGKSINIKTRVQSHIENAAIDAKERAIVVNSDHIEFITTDSEFKALLLESQLIQKHHPQYNRRWMDDKSYLYIKINMKDTYPKIMQVRREQKQDAMYFGPFPSSKIAREILSEIRKLIPFCTQKRVYRHVCFQSKIGLCNPCPSAIELLTDEKEKRVLQRLYKSRIRQVVKILNGNFEVVLRGLYSQLKELTEQERYEEAIMLRNKIKRFEYFVNEQLFASYDSSSYNQSEEGLVSLAKILSPYFPGFSVDNPKGLHRIECFDVSNLSGKEATASMVVLIDGLVDKSEYRRFKIKNLKSKSDFEMHEEVFTRRLKHRDWPLPDLLVVDGGKPQVRTLRAVFTQLRISIPLIGIAKRPDRFVVGVNNLPSVRPPMRDIGFNMIRNLRDESHRFAKKYHLLLREQKMMV